MCDAAWTTIPDAVCKNIPGGSHILTNIYIYIYIYGYEDLKEGEEEEDFEEDEEYDYEDDYDEEDDGLETA